ncbi:YheC/YheD family protein [Bacillus sp. S13(2024)]|uniref:YheC/YheD family protein n=1 Tax=unclassified Bacillus (in: firmicutes) TaxID=185979 RepID=UPI003D198EB1
MVLGILTSRFHHEREYYTEIAKRARSYHIVVVQFTPFSIDPQTELVNGLLFDTEKQDWIEQQFMIPSRIYNRCSYKDEKNVKKALPIIHWLQSRPESIFLNDELPNDANMYEILTKNNQLIPYIPAIKQASKTTTLQLLQTKKDVIIKPLHSLSKQNMYHIFYRNRTFHVTALERNRFPTKTFPTKDTFLPWLQSLLQTGDYTVQPILPHSTSPVHIRSILQKNKAGTWEELEKVIQIDNAPYSFLFPLTEQTKFTAFKNWQHHLSKIDFAFLQDGLHTITKETPRVLENTFPHLFELELSIVIDASGAVWLYHVDAKPTYTAFIRHNINTAEKIYTAPLRYYQSLLSFKEKQEL